MELTYPDNLTDGEDEYMGCPREMFALMSLRSLNLSFHGFRQMSPHIQQLTMLEELIISNCPVLESLPGELALLPQLRGLFISCVHVYQTSHIQSDIDRFHGPSCTHMLVTWNFMHFRSSILY